MPIQIGLLTKAAFAKGTLKRTFLIVNIADVALQVAGYAKGTFTVFTFVRLLAGVGA